MVFLCGIISILTAGCIPVMGNGRETEKISQEERVETMEEKITLEKEQKELLKSISINEEKVEEGKLSGWQKEVLRQYDYAMEYLKEKYPSYTFHIINCEPMSKVNQAHSSFFFYEGEAEDTVYDLYLYADEKNADEPYSAQDNFYTVLIKKAYEERLMQLMTENGISCRQIDAQLHTVQGKDFREGMDLEPIINGTQKMKQLTVFYIEETGQTAGQTAGEVKAVLEQQKIYGSFRILGEPEAGGETYQEDFNIFY